MEFFVNGKDGRRNQGSVQTKDATNDAAYTSPFSVPRESMSRKVTNDCAASKSHGRKRPRPVTLQSKDDEDEFGCDGFWDEDAFRTIDAAITPYKNSTDPPPKATTTDEETFSGLADEDLLGLPDPTTLDGKNLFHYNEDHQDPESKTLENLTQEGVDFDNLPDDVVRTHKVVAEPKSFLQPTMSQFYDRDPGPSKTPTLYGIVDFFGKTFHSNDLWRLKRKAKSEVSGLIVQIERILEENKKKIARVKPKFYLPLEEVSSLSKEGGKRFAEYRRQTGASHHAFVECQLHNHAKNPRFPLSMFDSRISETIESDFVFGSENQNTKKIGCEKTNAARTKKFGCFFKYNYQKMPPLKRPFVPRDANGRFTALDLYAGGGGFSLGLTQAGFHVSHHVDIDTSSCSTLQANFPESEVFQCTVEDFLKGCSQNTKGSRFPPTGSFALLHGSTPCQGFSLANRNGGANDDKNNQETLVFLDAIRHFQPPFVTFENVVGIADHEYYLHKMNEELLLMDYQMRENFLIASDYGDPQNRRRFIILAAKKGLELPDLPIPTHGDSDPSLLPRTTVKDALGFLETIDPLNYEGVVEASPDGGSGSPLSLQGHLLKVSDKDGDDDIHLVADFPAKTVLKRRVIRHYQNGKRPLTRLERAQLQSFPPTYRFYGTDAQIRDQIGNAVPVCLARAVGKSVMGAIQKSLAPK